MIKITDKGQVASITAAILLGLTAASTPNAFAGGPAEAVPPTDAVFGMTYGDWGAAWQQWIQSIPKENNPLFDEEGDNCAESQTSGPVFFLVGTFTDEIPETPLISEVTRDDCIVPANKYLFFPILNVANDTIPGDFFSPTEAAQRQTSSFFADLIDVETLRVTVDGKKVKHTKNLGNFRAQSPAYEFFLPQNNIFDADEGRFFGVTDGYWLMLKPLSPGNHEVHFEGAFISDEGEVIFALDIVYNLFVE